MTRGDFDHCDILEMRGFLTNNGRLGIDIMKTFLRLLICVLLALLFSSCATMYTKDHGFRETSAVGVNGAEVKIALKPMGGSAGMAFSAMVVAAGTGTTDGPFLWRVEAEGQEGVHEYLRVNKIRVTTSKTKRDEWYPRNNLNVNAPFKKVPGEREELCSVSDSRETLGNAAGGR